MRYCLILLLALLTLSPKAQQNVGIGTSTPNASSKLEINSTTSGLLMPRMNLVQRNAIPSPATGLMIYQTDNTPGFYFYNGSSWIQVATGSSTNFWPANGSHIYNANAGNVGIGTNTPSFKLTLQTAGGYGLVHTDGNIGVGTYIGGLDNAGWYGTSTNHPLMFFTNNGFAQMTLRQNGNVGIGTTAPDFKLSVESSTVESNNNTHVLKLKGRNPVLAFMNEDDFSYGYIKMWSNAPFAPYTNGLVIGTNPGYPLFFSTNNYGVSMMVADNGDIGMGTTMPKAKLHINQDFEALRISGAQPYLSFYNGSNYKGYLWNKNTDHIELGTSNTNVNGNIDFTIRSTPCLSIKNNGQVSIQGAPGIYGTPQFTVNGGLTIKNGATEWTAYTYLDGDLGFLLDGTLRAYIDVSGDWVSASDIRLKENILPYKSVLEDIKNLNVSTYRYKANAPGSTSFGLIAQNVAQYFPEIVSETKNKDGFEMLAIAYGKTGVLAIKAIQEQQVIIEKLLQRVEELEKRLNISAEKK